MTAFLNTLGLIAACVLIALWCAVSLLFSVAGVLILRSFEGLATGLASARRAFLPAVRRLASWFIRRLSWSVGWLRLWRRPLVRSGTKHVATLEDGDQWICDWAGKAIIVNPARPPRVVRL